MEMRIFGSSILLLCLVSTAFGQLPAPNAAGVSMGHYHLNVRDPQAHRVCWTTLGGTLVKLAIWKSLSSQTWWCYTRRPSPAAGRRAA
jgi:hypothetical protein